MQALRQEWQLRKGVHTPTPSPDHEFSRYQGQDIHLKDEYPFDDDYMYNVYTYKEESEEETSNRTHHYISWNSHFNN